MNALETYAAGQGRNWIHIQLSKGLSEGVSVLVCFNALTGTNRRAE